MRQRPLPESATQRRRETKPELIGRRACELHSNRNRPASAPGQHQVIVQGRKPSPASPAHSLPVRAHPIQCLERRSAADTRFFPIFVFFRLCCAVQRGTVVELRRSLPQAQASRSHSRCCVDRGTKALSVCAPRKETDEDRGRACFVHTNGMQNLRDSGGHQGLAFAQLTRHGHARGRLALGRAERPRQKRRRKCLRDGRLPAVTCKRNRNPQKQIRRSNGRSCCAGPALERC